MKAVILAAGQGERLRPLTNDKPKCLVELAGKSILSHQINVLKNAGVNDITIIGGYQKQHILQAAQEFDAHVQTNDNYKTTNMVVTLFIAQNLMSGDDDLIVSYGDIIYENRILDAVMNCDAPIALAVDKELRRLWELRMDDPLSDAETLRIDSKGKILELGRPPTSYDDIQGQYMGLFKISASALPDILKIYNSLDRDALYEGKTFDQMYMTAFLQHLIDVGRHIQAVCVENGWLEVDTINDITVYQKLHEQEQLDAYCKLS